MIALEILLAHRVIDTLTASLLDHPHGGFGAVLDGRLQSAHSRDIRQILSCHRRVKVAVGEKHVLRIAAATFFSNDANGFGADLLSRRGIFQATEHCLATAFLRPLGHHGRDKGIARSCVGVLVARRVHSATARGIEKLQGLNALPIVFRPDDLVMGYLRRQPAFLADANRLAHAVEHAERLVAHV